MIGSACCRMTIYQNYLFNNLHSLKRLFITPLILPSCLLLSSCIIIGISISLWLSILMKLVLVICLIHGKDPFLIRSSARYLIAMYCINKVPNIYKIASIFLLVLCMKQVISFQSNNRKWKKVVFKGTYFIHKWQKKYRGFSAYTVFRNFWKTSI